MCTPIVIDTSASAAADASRKVSNNGQALPEDRIAIGGTGPTTPPTELVPSPVATPAPAATPADTPAAAGTTPTTPAADPIADQNTLLINSLTTLAHQFSDTTTGILQGQKDASNALTTGFLNLSDQQQKALDAANQLRQNTGQMARKPSYSLSMAKTQRANSQGAASTMLTGATGVPTNQLALGRAQLLGGAPA